MISLVTRLVEISFFSPLFPFSFSYFCINLCALPRTFTFCHFFVRAQSCTFLKTRWFQGITRQYLFLFCISVWFMLKKTHRSLNQKQKGCSQKFSLFMLKSGKTYDEMRAAAACKSMNVCCL